MERRAKVELFEQIRREYEFGVGTVTWSYPVSMDGVGLAVRLSVCWLHS